MSCVGIQKHDLWLDFQTHGSGLLESEASRKNRYGRRETAQQIPEVFHSIAIGIHDDRVFLIHKNKFLPGIGVKLINAIPAISLFSLTKPINYPMPLELILKGHDNPFFHQRRKRNRISEEWSLLTPHSPFCAERRDSCAGELKGEWAVGIGRAVGEKSVEADAGPLDLVKGLEEVESVVEGVGIGKEGDGFFEEKRGEVFRKEAVGLVGEVDEGFCGVVPAGIFEIDIAECAIRLPKGIVEAEVGG